MSSNNQDMKPGDWMCPGCGDLVFARNDTCRSCNTPRPAGAGIGGKKGGGKGGMKGSSPGAAGRSWSPPKFQGNKVGGFPSMGFGGPMMPGGMPLLTGTGLFSQTKAALPKNRPMTGDWYCPNCGDMQFMKNEQCRQCGTARPEGEGPAQAMMQGDWLCPNCNDLVFARNSSCRRCQTPKPEGEGGVVGKGKGRPGKDNQKPGDWVCPNCKDLVFAKNFQCRMCGTTRDQRERSRSPPGGLAD